MDKRSPEKLLIALAKGGDLRKIRNLIEGKKVDVNASNSSGVNALVAAIKENHEKVVKYLISQGADVNYEWIDPETSRFWTSVLYSAHLRQVKTTKILLKRGAKLDIFGSPEIVMSLAIASDDPNMLELILEQNSLSVDYFTILGITSLMASLKEGKLECTKYLLEKGADYRKYDPEGDPMLRYALIPAEKGCLKTLLEFVKNKEGAEKCAEYVNLRSKNNGRTALHDACEYLRFKEIAILADYGAKPNMRDFEDQLPMILMSRSVLRFGVRPDLEERHMDWLATGTLKPESSEDVSTRKSLLSSLLVESAFFGDLEKVKELIERKKVDVNSGDSEGHLPLVSATVNGKQSVVKYLISKGAEVNCKTKINDSITATPIFFSTLNGHIEITKTLIDHGAKLNVTCGPKTLVEAAITSDKPKMLELILEQSKLNIEHPNELGDTPLMYALKEGKVKITRYLLDQGADYKKSHPRGPLMLSFALGILPTGGSCLETLLEFVKTKEGAEKCAEYVNMRHRADGKTALDDALDHMRFEEAYILSKYGAKHPYISDFRSLLLVCPRDEELSQLITALRYL